MSKHNYKQTFQKSTHPYSTRPERPFTNERPSTEMSSLKLEFNVSELERVISDFKGDTKSK